MREVYVILRLSRKIQRFYLKKAPSGKSVLFCVCVGSVWGGQYEIPNNIAIYGSFSSFRRDEYSERTDMCTGSLGSDLVVGGREQRKRSIRSKQCGDAG